MPKTQFGELLRQARLERGIPLREVARSVGLDPSRLSRIEHGERPPPPLPYIRALAQVLRVPMAELLRAAGTSKEVLETLLWSERFSFGHEEPFIPFHPELWNKNTYPVEVVERSGALVRVALGASILEVISFSSVPRLRITIPPEAVLISPSPPPAWTRNLFPARILKTRQLGDLWNLILACPGFELNALVPGWAGPEPGKRVWAAVPTPSIRTFPASCTGKEVS